MEQAMISTIIFTKLVQIKFHDCDGIADWKL